MDEIHEEDWKYEEFYQDMIKTIKDAGFGVSEGYEATKAKIREFGNKHEIDMVNCKYGSYAKGNLISAVESGKHELGTMT